MAYNGSGTFSLTAGNPVVTGTTISSTWANNTLTDIATGLSTAVCKDGQTTVTANLPMATFRHTGVGAGVATTDYARYDQVQNGAPMVLASVAGTNTVTGSVSPTPAAYVAGQTFRLVPAATNTGATTLNINSLGAGSVLNNGLALVGGEFHIGIPVEVFVSTSTPVFHIIGSGNIDSLPRGYISGCLFSNNSGDATNDIDFSVGVCRDSTNASNIACAALTKRLDADWVAGTNQGMRNSAAAITDTDYYLYAVATAAGVQDYYAHTSATVATVLTALQAETGGSSYIYARLIGWIKRASGAIVAFKTYETAGGGIEMKWDAPTLDVNLANTLTTSRRTDAVKVPLNFSTTAILRVEIFDASSGFQALVCCPDETDAAPSNSAAPLANFGDSSSGLRQFDEIRVRTSATGTVAARADLATVDLYAVVTVGFEWGRGN
jgi:hypothetical protein